MTLEKLKPGAALALAILAAIPLAYVFGDRAWATFAFQTFHESRAPFVAMTHLVDVIDALALAGIICSLVFFARGASFAGARRQLVLRVSLAVFAAAGVKDVLKLAFGRTWPETWVGRNPSFISDNVFGFAPFHGGAGWAAFPSGHMAVVCAFAASLWILAPKSRPFGALAVGVVAIGLLGADYHWLSDVLAGGLVGGLVGALVARAEPPQAG